MIKAYHAFTADRLAESDTSNVFLSAIAWTALATGIAASVLASTFGLLPLL